MKRTRARTLLCLAALLAAPGLAPSADAEDAGAGVAGSTTPADAASLERRIELLEARQKRLEGLLGQVQFRPAEPWTREGFWLASADQAFKLRLGGLVQGDDRAFVSRVRDGADAFVTRRARIYIEGDVHKYVSFRVLPDFAPGQPLIQEAWVDANYAPEDRLRVGKIKEPLSLERQQADVETVFVERGLPSDVAPNRDVGAEFHGRALGRRLEYHLAVVDGAADGASVDSDVDNSKDVVGRIMIKPFRGSGVDLGERFGFGVGASLGRARGATSASVPSYASEAQQTFFAYNSNVVASGLRRRLAPQAYWYPDHFGLLAEYVQSSQDFTAGTSSARLTTRAWQVQGSWVLTGETRDFNRLQPKRRFEPGKGWGAFELAARYSALWVDGSAFPVFASPTASARRADAESAGLNWYLSQNVRVTLDYFRTLYAGGPHRLEQAVITRAQMSF